MKVYLAKQCYYDGGANSWEPVVKVFDDEVKALVWKEDFKDVVYNDITHEWREYEEMEVE